jgi:hypothetical protein
LTSPGWDRVISCKLAGRSRPGGWTGGSIHLRDRFVYGVIGHDIIVRMLRTEFDEQRDRMLIYKRINSSQDSVKMWMQVSILSGSVSVLNPLKGMEHQ